MKNAFISGVSSGIGLSLAKQLLLQGYRVYGVSRHAPADIIANPHFRFCALDFTDSRAAAQILNDFIEREQIGHLSKLFLNVGLFGKRIAPLSKVSIVDLEEMVRVNVWSHKILLDCLLEKNTAIDCAVFSSSIAGVRARAGNSGYAITKAALNMMAKLYALENPEIHFLVLGLCNVDTFLSETIGSLPLEGDFPEIVKLRERAQSSNYLVSAEQRAADILGLFESIPLGKIPSGDFVEIRTLFQ